MLRKICSNSLINSFIKLQRVPFSSNTPPPKHFEEVETARVNHLKRQNRDFEEITIQRRPTKLPLTDTEIKKSNNFYDSKKGPFRETSTVFNFNEPVLNSKS